MITDYSKLSMTKLVNAYENYLADIKALSCVVCDVDVAYDSVREMYQFTLIELNSVSAEIIKRLNLKGEQKNG